ncbi:MAG: hypothetical protein RBT37_03865 [Dissulfurispiraceae bacterium]|nr:hypothetical protein [Dissulfurispiraceae bacterium]
MKKVICLAISLAVVFSMVIGCGKSEQQPGPKASDSHSAKPLSDAHAGTSAKSQKPVDVPADVKKTWKKVVLVIEDRDKKKKTEHVVDIGSEISLDDSNVKVKVLYFLPHFMIQEQKVTSLSNNPENPSVRISVKDNGKEIFDNWIYSKHPDIYTFDHNRFGIVLKEGLKN